MAMDIRLVLNKHEGSVCKGSLVTVNIGTIEKGKSI